MCHSNVPGDSVHGPMAILVDNPQWQVAALNEFIGNGEKYLHGSTMLAVGDWFVLNCRIRRTACEWMGENWGASISILGITGKRLKKTASATAKGREKTEPLKRHLLPMPSFGLFPFTWLTTKQSWNRPPLPQTGTVDGDSAVISWIKILIEMTGGDRLWEIKKKWFPWEYLQRVPGDMCELIVSWQISAEKNLVQILQKRGENRYVFRPGVKE